MTECRNLAMNSWRGLECSAFCSSRSQQDVNLATQHLRIKRLEEKCNPLLAHIGQKVRGHEGSGTDKPTPLLAVWWWWVVIGWLGPLGGFEEIALR